MKYFVTRKKIKIPRYYVLLVLIFSLIIILFIGNKLLNKVKNTSFSYVLLKNTFGFSNGYKTNFFWKNIFGFPLEESTPVFNENIGDLITNKEPLIYLYNTFQTDKYYHNYYNTYSINPVVTQGNLIFQEYLKKENINSMVETQSVAKILKENNIAYSLSYRGSRILLEKAYQNNPSLNYFLDIQVASETKSITTTSINDKLYARVLIVVGCLNNNYEKNLDLANTINTKLEEYPKLSRGVSLRCGEGYHGVYNQDFHENTLLLEVGGKENTIDEVNRTMEVLAKIFKEVLS